jgi:hypothetical protein
MTTLHSSVSQLATARQLVSQQWEQTKAVWNDLVRHHFERDYWQPLNQQLKLTQRALDKLDDVLDQAKRSVR